MTQHDKWISKAREISLNSKDPSTKVGCIIVSPENEEVSNGYNGNIPGCDESFVPIIRPNKYMTIVHAEQFAVIRAKADLRGCTAYVTDAPCEMCLKLMLAAGIAKVWYQEPQIMRDRSTPEQKAAIKALISATGAEVRNVGTGAHYLKELGLES